MIDRAPDQILRSVIAYCEWRAGESWRNLSTPSNRRDADRQDYLEAIRLIDRVRYGLDLNPHLHIPGASDAAAAPSCAGLSRGQIVARVMAANPALTDRRLLSRLSRAKLARMLRRTA